MQCSGDDAAIKLVLIVLNTDRDENLTTRKQNWYNRVLRLLAKTYFVPLHFNPLSQVVSITGTAA